MKNITVVLLICILFLSCKEEVTPKKKIEEDKKPNEIVMIFNKRSYTKDTLRADDGSYTVKRDKPIFYTNGKTYEKIFLEPNNISKTDTVKIKTDISIVVNHRYHFYYDSSYKFNVGDTIIFDYPNDAPHVSVLNNTEKNDYNVEVDYNLSHAVYKGAVEFYNENNKRFRTEKEKTVYRNVLKENIIEKEKTLDSLYDLKKLSSDYYSFLKTTIHYKNKIIHSNYSADQTELKNDSLLFIQSYQHFLNNFTFKHFDISYSQKGYQNLPDYLTLYDSIEKSVLFSTKIKNYLLYNTTRSIIKNYDQSKITKYFDKFKQEVKDTVLVNRILEDFLLDFSSLKTETADVNLINISKERKTLNEIIQSHKGKIIYVDFWASWCVPCREVMPDSKKLIQEYENKNIVFLFISIDTNFKSWKKAAKDENILYYRHSQLAINYPKATFFKDLQLKSIPRYLIFDTDGQLIHKNAPSPKSNDIRDILNSYISRK
ncbi:TlpA family protein disulfide reductase [Kordia sp.]|uniref:TlpA family protein disulfide reductase n=1 Tax=Kordia sp. TaxID=1965332 RepID=UPI003D27E270